ncbi:MAG TPA: flagellar export protein FliJ [Pirellulales bacterium]|jgi:flagellar export protein FliJ|nr:flagellar export protein FliJ [Pirellulales bacterium]
MANFQFRLATLLRLREAWRDERRAHLADAQRAEQLILERIATIDDELTAGRRQYVDAARARSVDVDLLTDLARYEMILKAQRQSADQQRQAVVAEMQKRRAALVAADRDVRVLEKLRDSQQQRHDEEEALKEFKRLDELAVLRHDRKETP